MQAELDTVYAQHVYYGDAAYFGYTAYGCYTAQYGYTAYCGCGRCRLSWPYRARLCFSGSTTYHGYTTTVATLLTMSILIMAAGGAGGVGLPDGTAAAAAG